MKKLLIFEYILIFLGLVLSFFNICIAWVLSSGCCMESIYFFLSGFFISFLSIFALFISKTKKRKIYVYLLIGLFILNVVMFIINASLSNNLDHLPYIFLFPFFPIPISGYLFTIVGLLLTLMDGRKDALTTK